MIDIHSIKREFHEHGGVLKTSQLNAMGLYSRQIKKLLEKKLISRIKQGYYELTDSVSPEEVVIARLFPNAVIYLESALMHYGYTDRIPSAWQIAVDKNSEKSQYKIHYPLIKPYYIEPKLLKVGYDTFEIEGITVKIFNRDRTICDVLRYKNKLEQEVFNTAIKSYINDKAKNLRRLYEYAELFRITNKVQTYIGVWI